MGIPILAQRKVPGIWHSHLPYEQMKVQKGVTVEKFEIKEDFYLDGKI